MSRGVMRSLGAERGGEKKEPWQSKKKKVKAIMPGSQRKKGHGEDTSAEHGREGAVKGEGFYGEGSNVNPMKKEGRRASETTAKIRKRP